MNSLHLFVVYLDVLDANQESRIRYKLGNSYFKLKDYSSAIRELETIPDATRDVKTHVLMGKIYALTTIRRNAILSYKQALSQNPLIIEAYEALITLNEDITEKDSDLVVREIGKAVKKLKFK